jgi:hypothetical protein
MVDGLSRQMCFPAPPDGLVDFVLARPNVSHGALSVPVVEDDTLLAGAENEQIVPFAKRLRQSSVAPEPTSMLPAIPASDWPLPSSPPFRGTPADYLSTAMDVSLGTEGDWQATLCGGVASAAGAAESYFGHDQLVSVDELRDSGMFAPPQTSDDSTHILTGDLVHGVFQPGFDCLSLNSPPAPPPPRALSPCDLGTFENTTFGLLPIY